MYMEKNIKLIMDESKNILVKVNNDVKLTILATNREINATDVFEIFKFEIGNKYIIEKENKNNIDPMVLQYFFDLFDNIAKQLNNISIDDIEQENNPW